MLWDSGAADRPRRDRPRRRHREHRGAGGIAVTTGDTIAFYGEGIPLDDPGTSADTLSYPAPTAPTLGGTITLGSAGFPIFSQTRTYSIAATVLDTSTGPALDGCHGHRVRRRRRRRAHVDPRRRGTATPTRRSTSTCRIRRTA